MGGHKYIVYILYITTHLQYAPTAGTVVLVVFLWLLLDNFVLVVVAHLMLVFLILAILSSREMGKISQFILELA